MLLSYVDFHFLMNLSHIIIQRFFIKHKVKETIKLATDAVWRWPTSLRFKGKGEERRERSGQFRVVIFAVARILSNHKLPLEMKVRHFYNFLHSKYKIYQTAVEANYSN